MTQHLRHASPFRGYAKGGLRVDQDAYAKALRKSAKETRDRFENNTHTSTSDIIRPVAHSVRLSILSAMSGPMTSTEIGQATGRSREQANTVLKAALAKGYVEVDRSDKSHVWTITEEGTAHVQHLINTPRQDVRSCKECGKYIRQRSVTGMCRAHAHKPGCECQKCADKDEEGEA